MASRTCQNLIVLFFVLCGLLVSPVPGRALAPEEVVVIVNTEASGSLELAAYYMRQRHIPGDHLVRISTAWKEHCSRKTYDREIRQPIREALARLGGERRIRCLVPMYGVPLAIEPPDPKSSDQDAKRRLEVLPQEQEGGRDQGREANRTEKQQVEPESIPRGNKETHAAVDSELALVLAGDYPLEGWLPNPYFLGFRGKETLLKRDTVLMVSRLDGPDPATVRRLIDDTLFAEQKGLQGRAYFDARWPKPAAQGLSGYALYDAALHAAAEEVRKSGRMEEVRLDTSQALFQPGDCPAAALYSGWYSLGHYVHAFTWVRGAIGYHIASGECTTLREPDSQVWCKRMLEEGVAATIGPVYEPYVEAFPLPDLFFQTLTEGYLSLAETYLISLPFLSWQMVLIGDPLYQPFVPK